MCNKTLHTCDAIHNYAPVGEPCSGFYWDVASGVRSPSRCHTFKGVALKSPPPWLTRVGMLACPLDLVDDLLEGEVVFKAAERKANDR